MHHRHALPADRRQQKRQAGALYRAISFDTDLYDALKIGLISATSTMRSNLGVGPPIRHPVARRDTYNSEVNYRIEPGEPYFQDLRERWSTALRAAHIAIRARLSQPRLKILPCSWVNPIPAIFTFG